MEPLPEGDDPGLMFPVLCEGNRVEEFRSGFRFKQRNQGPKRDFSRYVNNGAECYALPVLSSPQS